MAPSLETDYHVGAGSIILTITIADGQVGGSVVRLGNKELAMGDVKRVRIGSGASVKGKALLVKSVVTDVNRTTDRICVRYELKGGTEDRAFDLDASVKRKGSAVTYRATFNLKP